MSLTLPSDHPVGRCPLPGTEAEDLERPEVALAVASVIGMAGLVIRSRGWTSHYQSPQVPEDAHHPCTIRQALDAVTRASSGLPAALRDHALRRLDAAASERAQAGRHRCEITVETWEKTHGRTPADVLDLLTSTAHRLRLHAA
ncbi:hypothetical protein AB0D94_08060 [Streptomyces sp. NPDC048255]|uniref:DUF6197 family protein n=1 Tax=Streptomyces sp. NPDC048255 TaxID=3154713 RepID=UPI003411B47F